MKDYHYYHYYWDDCATADNASEKNCTRLTDPDLFSNYYYFDYELNKGPPNVTQFFIPFVFTVAFLIGIVGNVLIVVAVIRNKNMRTLTNFYFLNLALADLVFLVFCVPYTTTVYILESWPFGQWMCKLTNYLMIVTMATSIATLTAMTIDKHYTILYPIRAKIFRTADLTLIVIILIWAGSLLLLLPALFATTTVTFWKEGKESEACTEVWEVERHRQAYTLSIFCVTFVLPLTTVTIFYGKMWRALWPSRIGHQSEVTEGQVQSQGGHDGALRARRQSAKAVLVILIIFFVAWFPIHCIQIGTDFGVNTDDVTVAQLKNIFTILGHCLTCISSSIKPFVLTRFCKNFKKAIKKTVCCNNNPTSVWNGDSPVDESEYEGNNSGPTLSFPETAVVHIRSIAEDVGSDDPDPHEV